MSSDSGDKCDFCGGEGSAIGITCVYCNGTGEWNFAAQSYLKNHICQCITWDRKHCPVCQKKCHHGTTSGPRQTIDGGHGGQSNLSKNWDEQEKDIEKDMENYA